MTNWDISFLNDAWELGQREGLVKLTEVPEVLRQDLINFLFGGTIIKDEDGTILIFKEDYLAWFQKLRNKGFDYDIQLEPKKLKEE